MLQSMRASPKLIANRAKPCSALLDFLTWAVLWDYECLNELEASGHLWLLMYAQRMSDMITTVTSLGPC